MAEYYTPQVGYSLHINGEYHNTPDIEGFSQMMKDPSCCYKFYWLEAFADIISEGISLGNAERNIGNLAEIN